MKFFTGIVAMLGLIAACGLDGEQWVKCLIIMAVSAVWCIGYAIFIQGWEE